MEIPIFANVWVLVPAVITVVGSGSLLVLIIESMRDWFFKRREEYAEQSKNKIEIISKNIPYYIQLSMNAWNLGWHVIETQAPDYERLMYHMSNVLYFRHEITRKVGDIQLDNLEAENILNRLWQEINSVIEAQFGYLDTSKIRCLVENDMPYHKFHDSLSTPENKILRDKFVGWIICGLSKRDKEAFEKCMWYSQLIMLEMNHIYKSWYGEEPPLVLRDGLKKYLKEHQKYYRRIKSFHLKTTF